MTSHRALRRTLGDKGESCLAICRPVLETLATKDGEVVGRGTYEVSADGMTMTVSDGSGDQLIVLEKGGG